MYYIHANLHISRICMLNAYEHTTNEHIHIRKPFSLTALFLAIFLVACFRLQTAEFTVHGPRTSMRVLYNE